MIPKSRVLAGKGANVGLTAFTEGTVASAPTMRTVRRQARRLHYRMEAAGIEGVQISHYVGSGSPAAAILARAEESHADLIVMGAHGRTGIGEKLIGTVADRVLRHTTVPVLLYPEGAFAAAETD